MISGAEIRAAQRPVSEEGAGRAVVLACGAIGPVRYRLLSGTEVEVAGAETVQQALDKIRKASPKACISGFELVGGTAITLLQGISQWDGPRPPVIVVLKPEQRAEREACYAAGAAEVIDVADIDRIVTSLSRNAVVASGQFLRSRVDAPVTISYGNDTLKLRCADIRPTGIAVRGFEKPEIGVTVHLTLTIHDRPVQLWAQVARAWTQDGVPMAGLRFLGVTPEQRLWLINAIESLSKQQPPPPKVEEKPAIAAPPVLESEPPPPSEDAQQLAIALRKPSRASELPEWMRPLLGELTTYERQAALGARAPEWARRALEIRLELAKFRSKHRTGAPPGRLTEACQRLFDLLTAAAGEGVSLDVRADIDAVKDRIIQEFLEESADARGTVQSVIPPAPAAPRKERSSAPSEPRGASEPAPASRPLGLVPFAVAAAISLVVAVGLRVRDANTGNGVETVMSGGELWMPAIDEAQVSGDFATAVVAPSWLTKTSAEQREAVETLREKMAKRKVPVRFLLLMKKSGEPVGFFFSDRGELIDLSGARPLAVTRVENP